MSKSKDTPQKIAETPPVADDRRTFLKGAAVTTVAAGGGLLSANAMAEQEKTGNAVTRRGYQETDHVRDYYRLARF